MDIIYYFLLSWFITRFKPLSVFLNIFKDNIIIRIVKYFLGCIFCTSFWLTLFISNELFKALIVCFIAFWYDKIFSYYENTIKIK